MDITREQYRLKQVPGILLLSLFCFLTVMLLLHTGCREEIRNTINISGTAQGTTYNITYLAGPYSNFRESIDSIFREIDLSVSTYIPESIISRVNRNEPEVTVDDHFSNVFRKAMEVSGITNGAFDVTVGPLINAYGFGPGRKTSVDQALLDSLLKTVGYSKVQLVSDRIVKETPGVVLDFNAIAQGYTVDVLASFLESKGIRDYLVEVGGEIRAKGEKLDKTPWAVGIEKPDDTPTEGRSLQTGVGLKDQALATSGNYKKYYEEDGRRYTHIIDPVSGYPTKNNLLSATVVAGDCMTADAYATAFIVMGLERSRKFLSEHKDLQLEVFFIYDDGGVWKTYSSEDFPSFTSQIP